MEKWYEGEMVRGVEGVLRLSFKGGRRGVVVTRLIQSAKLLYAGPG